MKTEFKILHLEDVKKDVVMVERELKKHHIKFTNKVVDCKKDFLQALNDYFPDVILSAHSLPEINSEDALKIVRKKGLKTPFILVTSPISEKFAVNIIKLGADDYVLKDNLQRLPHALTIAVEKNLNNQAHAKLLIQFINQRKLSQENNNNSSDRMLLAVKAANVGVWEWEIAQNTLEWDPVMHFINGMDPDCFSGGFENWEKCMHPDDIAFVRNEMYKALTGEKELDMTFRVVWSDKSIHFIRSVGIVQLSDEGIPERMLGTNWDITEKKVIEKEIARSENFYRALIENSSDVKCLTDELGYISFVSPSVKDLFGYEPQELIGKTRKDLIHPDDWLKHEKQVKEVIDTPGKSLKISMRCIAKNRNVRFCEGVIANLLDQSGINSIICTFWDITERKTFEEHIESQNQQLLKANKELDNFVYSASHELRSPLCSLLGLIDLVGTETNQKSKTELLAMMKKSVLNLDNLIRDIVDYSKNNRQEIETEPVDFKLLIQESISKLSYLPEMQKVRINLDVNQSSSFYTDKKRLCVVISNILTNSIKYYDPAKSNPFVRIALQANKEHSYIIISDNGLGIPANYEDKIFDMFYRANSQHSGAGLGLYIAREIIEKLSGNIFLNTEEGGGTTVYVKIPNSISSKN
ncbi:MAG: PAS domain-containing protein [Daejeonella sp.]